MNFKKLVLVTCIGLTALDSGALIAAQHSQNVITKLKTKLKEFKHSLSCFLHPKKKCTAKQKKQLFVAALAFTALIAGSILVRKKLMVNPDFDLVVSAGYGDTEGVREALRRGANPNTPIRHHFDSPMEEAARFLKVEMVQDLLNAGASINLSSEKRLGNLDLTEIDWEQLSDFSFDDLRITAITAGSDDAYPDWQERTKRAIEIIQLLESYYFKD